MPLKKKWLRFKNNICPTFTSIFYKILHFSELFKTLSDVILVIVAHSSRIRCFKSSKKLTWWYRPFVWGVLIRKNHKRWGPPSWRRRKKPIFRNDSRAKNLLQNKNRFNAGVGSGCMSLKINSGLNSLSCRGRPNKILLHFNVSIGFYSHQFSIITFKKVRSDYTIHSNSVPHNNFWTVKRFFKDFFQILRCLYLLFWRLMKQKRWKWASSVKSKFLSPSGESFHIASISVALVACWTTSFRLHFHSKINAWLLNGKLLATGNNLTS